MMLFLSELDIHRAETRNEMIVWNHSSSGDDIKSKFGLYSYHPRENGNTYFLMFIS